MASALGAAAIEISHVRATARTSRLESVDRMRGLVIMIMALDHVRDFFHVDSFLFSPTDLSHTYPALFLTRFVTHYCAPTFVLLAGASAFLRGEQLRDKKALARFLASRGLWLILLDAFVVSPVWTLSLGKIELGVLWAIGVSMVALSLLIRLTPRATLVIGAVILAFHNMLDGVHAEAFGAWAPFWRLLHEPGPLPFGLSGKVLYPALPWFGVMALGYGSGPLFLEPARKRGRILRVVGLGAIVAFAVLRATNLYGDPRPWSPQADDATTALSFLNVTKYPPSLLYALVTLGPALLLLPALERLAGFVGETLATFGRVPLFVYVLHLYAALAGAGLLALAQGIDFNELREFATSGVPPKGFGVDLPGVYLAWIALLLLLYPACRWFANVKRRRRSWWLSYL